MRQKTKERDLALLTFAREPLWLSPFQHLCKAHGRKWSFTLAPAAPHAASFALPLIFADAELGGTGKEGGSALSSRRAAAFLLYSAETDRVWLPSQIAFAAKENIFICSHGFATREENFVSRDAHATETRQTNVFSNLCCLFLGKGLASSDLGDFWAGFPAKQNILWIPADQLLLAMKEISLHKRSACFHRRLHHSQENYLLLFFLLNRCASSKVGNGSAALVPSPRFVSVMSRLITQLSSLSMLSKSSFHLLLWLCCAGSSWTKASCLHKFRAWSKPKSSKSMWFFSSAGQSIA